MLEHELLKLFPTPDHVFALSFRQLDKILLDWIGQRERRAKKDPIALRFISSIELQGIHPVGFPVTLVERQRVDRLMLESLQRLQSDGLIVQSPGQSDGAMILSTRGWQVTESGLDIDMALMRLALRPEMLHPDLRAAAYENFADGRYDTAIFEAFKCLEVAVRSASGIQKKMGPVELMREAFEPKSGPLKNKKLNETDNRRVQELFMGAFGVFRNQATHSASDSEDLAPAIEELMLVSRLLRFVKP